MNCPKCGANEPHFAPPSMGEPGFYLCECGREPLTDEHISPVLREPFRPTVTVVVGTQTDIELWLTKQIHEQLLEVDDLRAKLQAAKDAMETNLIYVTSQMDEHPDGYEGPCWCRVCRSYATDDGEGKP